MRLSPAMVRMLARMKDTDGAWLDGDPGRSPAASLLEALEERGLVTLERAPKCPAIVLAASLTARGREAVAWW